MHTSSCDEEYSTSQWLMRVAAIKGSNMRFSAAMPSAPRFVKIDTSDAADLA